jgi:nucleotide-binding universal stress UspA family protein
MTTQKILIPLDGSEFSGQILPYLPKFFDPAENEIIFLRVAGETIHGLTPTPPQLPADIWSEPAYQTHRDAHLAKHPIYASQVRGSMEAELEEALREDLRMLRDSGYRVSIVIKFGDPAQEILEFIEMEKIDLVAMTTHGRTGLTKLIFGSVAEKVLHKVAVPIMLLRPAEHTAKKEAATGRQVNVE